VLSRTGLGHARPPGTIAPRIVWVGTTVAEIGELIAGRYRLVNRIAVGGMGVVWEGRDELLARQVAVKQVLTQPGLSGADAMLARNRVIREARITARLHHPNAVTIYDVVDDGDYPCLIMQFVPSTGLNGLLRERGTLPLGQVARIGTDLARALHAAHQVGIVHRDVKPANVLITEDGSAKLTDFGISHAIGDVTLTSTGMVSGTPAYLAPEVARGGESGFAADVFSLGATMYAALEGAPPFGLDTNPMAVLHRVASGQLIPPKQSGPLTPLLLAMMAPNPADRPTMAEVSRALIHPAPASPQRPPAPPVTTRAAQTLPVSRTELAAELASSEEPAARGTAPQQPKELAELMASPRTGSSEPANTSRGRRPVMVFAACAVVLVAILTAGYFLLNGQDGGQGSVAATAAQTSDVSPEVPESSTPATDVVETQESAATTPSSTETSASTTETSASTTETPAGSAEAATLTAAVNDYYALMPGNTDAGWARLTANFQSGIAQNRDYYNSFWGGVESVGVTDAVGTPPGTVEATITYTFKDGTQSVERTQYQLVQDGAELKIDNSTVLS